MSTKPEAARAIVWERSEPIVCPGCAKLQPDARVVLYEGNSWPTYVHECACGYVTTESEWERAK